MLYLTRVYDFAASHRLHNPNFSDEKNWAVFDLCNNPNGHGHNYEIEVIIKGQPDPESGMVVNLLHLDKIVEDKILKHVDHKHLNFDVDFLSDIIPSAENLAVRFYDMLEPLIPEPGSLHGVRVFESRKNMAEYYGKQVPLLLS